MMSLKRKLTLESTMRNSGLYILAIFTVLLTSCGRKGQEFGGELKKVSAEEIVASLDSIADQDIRSFYAKFTTKYSDSSKNYNFKTSLRIIHDSIVSADIRYSAIPILNSLITKDSLFISNRRDKCYKKAELAVLKEQFGINFKQADLEHLFYGFPVGIVPGKEYHKEAHESDLVICSHSKKELKKTAKDGGEDIITRYYLSADRTTYSRVVLESLKDSVLVDIKYSEREVVQGVAVPGVVEIEINSPNGLMQIRLGYSKVRVNEEEQIVFVIPDSYEECSDQ